MLVLLNATSDEQALSFWIWDKRMGGIPFEIQPPTSVDFAENRLVVQRWSPHDQWLLLVGMALNPGNRVADLALTAIRLPP